MKAGIALSEKQINLVLANINDRVRHFQLFDGGFINPIYEVTTQNHGELILRVTNPLPKWARRKTRNEIEVMTFLRQNTTIPVPKLHDASDTTELIGYEYLLMDKVPGTQLSAVYAAAPLDRKCEFLSEILSYIAQMQKFTFPQIGSFRRGLTLGSIPDIEAGPFPTIGSFLEASIRNRITDLKQKPRFSPFVPRLLQFASSLEKQAMEPHPFVLTHSDFDLKNILVQDGKVTAVLDYEWAGAFPDYFDLMYLPEYFQFEQYPPVKQHFLEQVKAKHLVIDISDRLRDYHEIEGLAMSLASYPAWFIGRESEGETFAVRCTSELDLLLKKYAS